ncbi:MAG: tryptophan synthase subunit alpha [Dysgonamonadaceae bacterium]|nr:tryptophan synthase subunit alpha [Dysgonamonadaceae bacterium]
MNRIQQLFQKKQKNILSVFFTAGYPHLDDTREIIIELEKKGVDMLEIGIPFSDPMADGLVIQESSSVALKNGMNLKKLFEPLQDIRKEVDMPLVMMGYLNPVMQFGFENFCKKCAEAGVDGMIIPDLPFRDYMESYKPVADKYDLKMIMLITPETSEERISLIDEHTEGFIYMVSSASTTGTRQSFGTDTKDYFHKIHSMGLRNPLVIGFGISNKETLQAAHENANGAIIGSKFIKALASENTIPKAVSRLMEDLQ